MARWPSSRTLDLSFQGGRFKSCHGLSGSDLRQVVHTHEHSGCSGLVVLRARSRKVAGSQLSRAGLGGLLYSLPRGRLPVAHITATQMTQNVVSPRLQNIVATWTQNAPRVVHVIIRHLLGLRLLSLEEGVVELLVSVAPAQTTIVANATVDSSVTVRETSPIIEKGMTVANITDWMFYLFSLLKFFFVVLCSVWLRAT